MVRTAIAISECAKFGSSAPTLTAADAVNNHDFLNDGQCHVLVQNASASPVTVTAISVADPVAGRTGDLALTVPANSLGVFPKLDPAYFNQTTGKAHIDVSAATSIKLAVVRMKNV